MYFRLFIVAALAAWVGACAGRDPNPVPTVQAQDQNSTCTMITAEIEANNVKMKELADEQEVKVAQNVLTGVGGLLIPVLWFGMDWKGAANKDVAALQARQQYLTTLATERCRVAGAPQPSPAPAVTAAPKTSSAAIR